MQLDLSWADLKLVGDSWAFLGKGITDGFYAGGRGQKAFFTDLAWATAISVFYIPMIEWRVAFAGVGIIYQAGEGIANAFRSLGNQIGGDVGVGFRNVGDMIGDIFDFGARVFTITAAFAFAGYVLGAGLSAGLAGGVVYGAGQLIQGIGHFIGGAQSAFDNATGSHCFITTAVMESLGERDDGATLSLLRRFRDEYVRYQPNGMDVLQAYYQSAPLIVKVMNEQDDRERAWAGIFSRWIGPIAKNIASCNYRDAMLQYEDMVANLARLSGVFLSHDPYTVHWKRAYIVDHRSSFNAFRLRSAN
jgi:hypothetical protein